MSQRRSPPTVAGPSAQPARGAPSAELPSWLWGLIGCMSVLVVGFAGLWWMASSGMMPSQIFAVSDSHGRGAKSTSHVGGPLQAGIQVEPIAVPIVPPPPPVAVNEARRPSPRVRPLGPAAATRVTRLPVAQKGAAPAAAAGKPAADDADDQKAPAEEPAKGAAAVRDVSPSDDNGGNGGSMPAVLREISGPDEERPRAVAPKAQVEAALTALAPRVRRCFFKFQIPGRAQVGLTVTPAGSPESVTVSGDFENTPTGQCIADEVAAATLPSFKGAPMKLSYTYQLR